MDEHGHAELVSFMNGLLPIEEIRDNSPNVTKLVIPRGV